MGAANRYAKSLMDLAIESNQLDALRKDMKVIASAIENSRDLERLLESPVVKNDKKIKVLTSIFEKNIGKTSLAFLKLITEKNRESQLKNILDSFEELYKEYKNIHTAVVTSANGLDQKTREKVLDLIKGQLKGEVELVEKIDKNTIGGFVLRIGDTQVDRSVASELSNLRKRLTNKVLN